MSKEIWKTEPYEVSPEGLKLDNKIVDFNSLKPEEEYESLKALISDIGQIDPISYGMD